MHLMRMEAQNPPSKIARLADSESGGFDFASKMKGNLGSINDGKDTTPIGLGLELGRGSYGVQKPSFQRSSGFTFLQFQELEHQSHIYKYMEAGLPVPYHLVLPIWKSLSGSVGSHNGGLCPSRYNPSFGSPLNLNYQSIQDPEPGRCKRTDGKKWRCSKEAVRDFKYCERHMHRGRHQRSRKHVETEPSPSHAATSSTNSRDLLHSGTNLTISLQAPMSNTTNNVSPRLVFSPTSILQGGAQRTDPS